MMHAKLNEALCLESSKGARERERVLVLLAWQRRVVARKVAVGSLGGYWGVQERGT